MTMRTAGNNSRSTVFILWGEKTRQPLSQDGRVIFHTNREEMEFLFPRSRVKAVDMNPLEGLPLKYARGMEAIQFPLVREDFKVPN